MYLDIAETPRIHDTYLVVEESYMYFTCREQPEKLYRLLLWSIRGPIKLPSAPTRNFKPPRLTPFYNFSLMPTYKLIKCAKLTLHV